MNAAVTLPRSVFELGCMSAVLGRGQAGAIPTGSYRIAPHECIQ